MKRKHMPGCYCCQCPCGTVDPPDITIPNYTSDGIWRVVDDCCKYIRFFPDSDTETSCLVTLHEKTIAITGTHSGYALNRPVGVSTNCDCPPDPVKFCIPDPPLVKVATLVETFNETARLQLLIRYAPPTIDVIFGRHNFTCDSETSCKWFLKLRVCYDVSAEYIYYYEWEKESVKTSNHSCFSWRDPDTENSNGNSTIPCTLQEFLICFERIKIWDELPEDGELTFANDDVGAECEEKPACAQIEFDDSSYCISSPSSLGDEELCYTFSVVEDTVTYEFGGNTISSFVCPDCSSNPCVSDFVDCSENPTVCPVVTATLRDDFFSSPEIPDPQNPWNCIANGPLGFNRFDGFCTCYVDQPLLNSPACLLPECDTGCCHFFDCGECGDQCNVRFDFSCSSSQCPSFSPGYLTSSEFSVSDTCGQFNQNSCCINFQNVTLDIEWA